MSMLRRSVPKLSSLAERSYQSVRRLHRGSVTAGLGEALTPAPSCCYWRLSSNNFASVPQLVDSFEPLGRGDSLSALPLGEGVRQVASFGQDTAVFETGRYARLSDGACTVQIGATHVLATAVADRESAFTSRRQHFANPLQVSYVERLSAVGRIPGGYHRRETGGDEELSVTSSIERAIKPLFPPGFSRNSQVCATLLSSDGKMEPDVLAINAASAALMCSNIPWGGPVAAVRVAAIGGNLVINPVPGQAEAAGLNLLYVGTQDEVVLLELQAKEAPESLVMEAISLAHTEAAKLMVPQLKLGQAVQRLKKPMALSGADRAAAQTVQNRAEAAVRDVLSNADLGVRERTAALDEAKARLHEQLKANGFLRFEAMRIPGSGCVSPMDLDHAWEGLIAAGVRDMVLKENLRVDGRGLIDHREAYCRTGHLPIVHGSAISNMGETQVMSAVTVGHARNSREQETALETRRSQFFVHFTSPASASNEIWRSRSPSRAEVMQARFVELALEPVFPPENEFPFAVRVNTDVLAADGSLAETAICSASLAMDAANVPISALVAGISMGMISDAPLARVAGSTLEHRGDLPQRYVPRGSTWELLTDLQGLEEEHGDMHVAIAGTRAGLTALQLDCSVQGVPLTAVEAAILAARKPRMQLLDSMEQAAAHGKLAEGGPLFGSSKVAKEHIGRIIGPMGSNLRSIEESTGARVCVQDQGSVHYFAPTREQYRAVEQTLDGITGSTVKEGQKYSVKVVKLVDYGVFVELPNGFQTLVHISELSHDRVRSVEDLLEIGQKFEVLCLGKDSRGFLKMSRKALLEREAPSSQKSL